MGHTRQATVVSTNAREVCAARATVACQTWLQTLNIWKVSVNDRDRHCGHRFPGRFFDRDEKHHQWMREQTKRLEPGLVTCEAVMAEASYLLQRVRVEPEALLSLIQRGLITLPFRLEEEVQAVTQLLRRYRNVPMSLADACLVRLSELYGDVRS